jgi:dTDP-4-amino-4,6-dideoxygalactose transaminase
MTDIKAALGASQMCRIDEFVKKRREFALYYDKHLCDLPVITPYQSPECQSAWHLYVICLKSEQIKKSRREVFDMLRAADIGVNVHYIPVHTHPYYQDMGFAYGDFPEAESYYERAVSLPIYSGLRTDQQDYIIDTLKKVLV